MTSVVKLALQNLSNEEVKELKVLAEARGIRSNSKDNHAISRAERVDVLPLSFAQQRVWFMSQEDKNSASYHIPIAFRIYGDIDSLAMQRSFQGLLDRHESLRTVFSVSLDGQPHARLLSTDANFRLLEIDLMGHLDGTKALKELVREQSLRPFDLTQGPLIRACMVHLRDQEHVLIVIQHHIVSDGWSIGILLRELSALYNAFVRGSPSSLSPLEIQYPDYASWQRTWFNDNR
ncbi:Condensation domain-containing protein, partial [Paraburkholderia steynii]